VKIINVELLRSQPANVKFLLNDSGLAFFPATQQHRDMKFPGLSYEDDHRGNALAGLVQPGRVDIRFHSAFSDERIRQLWSRVLASLELSGAQFGTLYYQGRDV
jgi:hypothetical protein